MPNFTKNIQEINKMHISFKWLSYPIATDIYDYCLLLSISSNYVLQASYFVFKKEHALIIEIITPVSYTYNGIMMAVFIGHAIL